ncbi:MAG: hypothetical protein U0670_11465 [Anaerolineae bacterium]
MNRTRHFLNGSVFVVFTIVVLMLPLTGILAQSNFKIIALSERYQVRVPNDWTSELADDGSTSLYGDGWAAFVYSPDILEQNLNIASGSNAVDVLRTSYILYFSSRAPQERNVTTLMVDGRNAAYFETEEEVDGQNYEYQMYAIQLSDKAWGTILLVGLPGYLAANSDRAQQIVESFDVDPVILRQEIAEARGLNPCLVSTQERDSARLRVGPGENRTSVAFLPAGDPFTVTGRFVDTSGGVWYQLVKEEAAPQSAAAEIWVSAEEVDSTGDCDVIGDTNAPPVIPISPSQPQNPNTGGDATRRTPAPWLVSSRLAATCSEHLSPIVNASCQGGGNVQVPIAEVISGTEADNVTVLNGGAQLRFGTDVWTRAADGSAFYSGNVTFAPGSEIPVGQVYLTVVSQTELRGNVVGNWTIDGTPCSLTDTVSLRRQ